MNNREFLSIIMPEIEKYFLRNGKGHVILEGYDYIREIITLYAKQHNLVESTLVLIDNKHNEEAYILSRSILNNYFLIGYLIGDDKDRRRLKEYQIQPALAKKRDLDYIKKNMNRSTFKNLFKKDEIKQKIKEVTKYIEKQGFSANTNLLSIRNLAKNSDAKGIEFYLTYYNDASKYEHSDISSLEIYKQPIFDDISRNAAFILDMDRTDEELAQKIYNIIIFSYIQPFIKLIDIIISKEPHLKINYNVEKLINISKVIYEFLEKNN